MKQENRGGARENAGRIPMFDEPTISVQCPESKEAEIRAYLKKWYSKAYLNSRAYLDRNDKK